MPRVAHTKIAAADQPAFEEATGSESAPAYGADL